MDFPLPRRASQGSSWELVVKREGSRVPGAAGVDGGRRALCSPGGDWLSLERLRQAAGRTRAGS